MDTTSFEDFMREVEAEAVAEGPAAVTQLRALQEHYRKVAEELAARRFAAPGPAEGEGGLKS